MSKRILVIGSGGREHAIAWKLSQSSQVERVFLAPGTAATGLKLANAQISVMDFEAVINFAKAENIDLVLVVPDDPLAAGMVDALAAAGIKAWGPNQQAAQIESSKAFAKDLMQACQIPTAEFRIFKAEEYEQAKSYIEEKGAPIVVKASGLALGKGAIVCKSLQEAKNAIKQIMIDKSFGEAGNEVVIEEFLEGPEISVHAFCDGKNSKLLPLAQDHKPVGEGNTGPNTGGMGTIAPLEIDAKLLEQIKIEIVDRTLDALSKEGIEFKGLLYPGLILTKDGPKVLEFNARFGDPETQSYMRLLETDLLEIIEASLEGRLDALEINWKEQAAASVILASGGYPEAYEKGKVITGVDAAAATEDIEVFFAGVKQEGSELLTNGGRVLAVSATAASIDEALQKAYVASELISFEGKYLRRDLGEFRPAKLLSSR